MRNDTMTYDDILKEYLKLQKIGELNELEYDYKKDYYIPSEKCVDSLARMLMSDKVEYHCLCCHSIFPESMLRKDHLGNMQGCPRCDGAGFNFKIRRIDQGNRFVASALLGRFISPDEARKSGYEGIQIDWDKKEKLYEKYYPEYPEPDIKEFINKYFNLKDAEVERHQVEVCDLKMIYEIMQELERISERTASLDRFRDMAAPKIVIEKESNRLNKRIVDFYKEAQMTIDKATKQEMFAISKLVDIYIERQQERGWKKNSKWKTQFVTIKEIYEKVISSDNRKNDIFQKSIRMHGSGFSKQ